MKIITAPKSIRTTLSKIEVGQTFRILNTDEYKEYVYLKIATIDKKNAVLLLNGSSYTIPEDSYVYIANGSWVEIGAVC